MGKVTVPVNVDDESSLVKVQRRIIGEIHIRPSKKESAPDRWAYFVPVEANEQVKQSAAGTRVRTNLSDDVPPPEPDAMDGKRSKEVDRIIGKLEMDFILDIPKVGSYDSAVVAAVLVQLIDTIEREAEREEAYYSVVSVRDDSGVPAIGSGTFLYETEGVGGWLIDASALRRLLEGYLGRKTVSGKLR